MSTPDVFTVYLDSNLTSSTTVVFANVCSDQMYRKFLGLIGLSYEQVMPSFDVSLTATETTYMNFSVSMYQAKNPNYLWEMKFHYMISGSQYNAWIYDETALVKQPPGTKKVMQFNIHPAGLNSSVRILSPVVQSA